jgi:UV DNA damage endonuclease
MHPDQFTLINSLDTGVFERSLEELRYHARVLDLMRLDAFAKIQIHVGGGYGDTGKSITRFIERFGRIDEGIRRRLVVENDDRIYRVEHCLRIHGETRIPVLFDVFHHEANNSGTAIREMLNLVAGTWKERDGIPMVDYSSQKDGERKGRHTQSIDPKAFKEFLEQTRPFDFDLMLEIKDKEKSALKAIEIASDDPRFKGTLQEVH